MNRMEEYRTLMDALSRPPRELEGCADRAVRRARRGRRPWQALASAAAVWALFVIMVNASPAFAVTCARVPFLKELTAAVAFSPSLRAAVEHDFVQYVGQSRTGNGLTVTLEYVIADESQIIVFYRTSRGRENLSVSCDASDGEGRDLRASLSQSSTEEELKRFTLHLWEEGPLPETLNLELHVRALEEAPQEGGTSFAFSLRLDPGKTASMKTVPVNRWIELDGQRLLVDRLELTPTRTALYLDDHPDNSRWLEGLRFYFTDSAGRRYDALDSTLSAVGREGGETGTYTYFYQSLYFLENPERLTLHITQSVWLDKDAPPILVDLTQGTAENLPEGVEVLKAERAGTGTALWFSVRGLSAHSALSNAYLDPEGNQAFVSEFSYSEQEDGSVRQRLLLPDCTQGSVTLFPAYTAVFVPEIPVAVELG